jgi:hypothetical protein
MGFERLSYFPSPKRVAHSSKLLQSVPYSN